MKIDHKIENGHDEYYAAENGVVEIGEEQTVVEKGQNISDLVEMGGLIQASERKLKTQTK